MDKTNENQQGAGWPTIAQQKAYWDFKAWLEDQDLTAHREHTSNEDIGGNVIPDRVQANLDRYKGLVAILAAFLMWGCGTTGGYSGASSSSSSHDDIMEKLQQIELNQMNEETNRLNAETYRIGNEIIQSYAQH